ncbi:uncharacterized protein LOC128223167 [Mya arenaria]|uniref:uncharacterized protein LOC128223089 n=1 Tax=Mya arenaria TaxID=6604 RepID=UPI0022E96244|nr:uncharacterized protein LOC128223089 [Mya arenaria]XP_052788422.1 uncharacterized protein LOC128223167 [Mya arenaria]
MEKSGHAPAPVPISADEAAFHVPPPSYEEVMGAYQTSFKPGPDSLPQLAYIDIMPRCLRPGNIKGKLKPEFDNFSAVVTGANRWLADHPELSVWKCECVQTPLSTARDGSLYYDLNSMVRHDSTYGYSVYLKGLRMWLTTAQPGSTPQQLGLRTAVPEVKTIELPNRYRKGRIIVGDEVQTFGYHQYTTLDGLQGTLKRLNEKLKSDPIPGRILTIGTDMVKAFDQFKLDLDPDAACWDEDKDRYSRVTQVLRIFYLQGPPGNEEIGLTDFRPQMTQRPDNIAPGKLELFDQVMSAMGQWVTQQKGSRIVNIQQFDAIVEKTFDNELKVETDSTDDAVWAFKDRRLAKTLRVFQVTSGGQAVAQQPNHINSRLFLPARMGPKVFESMTQTMDRVDFWLRVTGANVYNVETVKLLLHETQPAGADVAASEYRIQKMTGKYWLTAIRVYIAGPYNEPDPSQLPPVPLYKSGSGSCTIV